MHFVFLVKRIQLSFLWGPGRVVVLYFLASTAVCLALGIPILLASLSVKVYSVRYDDSGPMRGLDSDQRAQLLYARDGEGVPLTVELLVTEQMKAPVMFCPWLGSCCKQDYLFVLRCAGLMILHNVETGSFCNCLLRIEHEAAYL
jgi:hypothetical protein